MDPKMINAMVREKARMTEQCLVGCVESIEGRVPNNEEVACYARRELSDRMERFFWKDILIVEVRYWPSPRVPYQIFSLVNPFNPVPQ
jgi:hypothetical protein